MQIYKPICTNQHGTHVIITNLFNIQYRGRPMCFSGPIPIITAQVDREPIYVSGVKMKMNAKINNNKSSDKKNIL